MKKNLVFKILTIVFVYVLLLVPVKAADSINSLTKIVIEKSDVNTYQLDLQFQNKYRDNAFLQKSGEGTYSIFIPDTIATNNKIKISHKDSKDKAHINVKYEEKPFITEDKQSRYIKLDITSDDDYSIKMTSNLYKENKVVAFFWGLAKTIGVILTLAFLAIFGTRVYQISTSVPTQRTKVYTKRSVTTQRNRTTNKHVSTPNTTTVRKTLSSKANDDSFSCFNVDSTENMKNTSYDYQKAINQNSVLTANQKQKSRIEQTNPIKNPDLDLPFVTEQIEPIHKPELISVLNITPTTGFYLTNVGETLALFGFVGENIYLFKKFSDLSQINLQAKYYDKHGTNDLYIVKLDTYKAMIEISANGMKELAVL